MPLVLRLALRDLRGGLGGFGIFLACIALGVAAISGVGSVSRSLSDGLAKQGRVILGGDASFDLIQRAATPAEIAFFQSKGTLAAVSVLRAMARRDDGSAALVELKAVGADYPATGKAVLDPPMPLAAALAAKDGVDGIVADPAFAARLDLKIGDAVKIGDHRYVLRPLWCRSPTSSPPASASARASLMSDAGLAASG